MNKMEKWKEEQPLKTEEEVVERYYPDGGWGWIVVIACFFVRVIVHLPVFSILFAGLITDLNISSTTVAWIFNLHLFMVNVMKLFVGPLGDVFGWRKVIIFAGGLKFLCLLLVTQIQSPWQFFIFFSLLSGTSNGLAVCTCLIVVPSYFDKRRGLASAIMAFGLCGGQFVAPVMITYMLESYSFKGTCALLAAISLNICVSGMILHPVSWCSPEAPVVQKDQLNECAETNSQTESENVMQVLFTIGKKVASSVYTNLKVLSGRQAAFCAASTALLMTCHVNFNMIVAFAMQEKGFTLQQTAWTLSLMAVFATVSRIVVLLLTDWPWLRVRYCFMLGLAGFSAFIIAFTFTNSSLWIIVCLCGAGGFSAISMSVYNLFIIEEMGMDRYPAVFGGSGILVAVSSLTIGSLFGTVRDASSSYNTTLWLISVLVVVSLFFVVLLPLAKRFDDKKKIRARRKELVISKNSF